MSDHIAHLAICDDTFRLARLHPEVHPEFKLLFDTYLNTAHLGSITRYADKWSADLIAWASTQHAAGEYTTLVKQKLSFVLGALTHRSADRLTKPITNCWSTGADSGHGLANESKIYQDVFAFKEVYGSGLGPLAGPFCPEILQQPIAEAEAKFETYFRVLWQRGLIGMHTIKPDPDSQHIHTWLNGFMQGLQEFPKQLRQYAQIASEWDPEKVKKYLIEKRFYDRQDPLIVLARDIQRGSRVTPEQLLQAWKSTDKTHSRWARTLAKALDYLLAASELFDRRIDLEVAKTRFDIGVPELSLQE